MNYQVKYWTSTADIHLAAEGYGSEHFAPGYQEPIFSGYSDYKSLHNCFITHAMVYKIYNEEFREKQKGKLLCINEYTYCNVMYLFIFDIIINILIVNSYKLLITNVYKIIKIYIY